jgi:hypothetical protein
MQAVARRLAIELAASGHPVAVISNVSTARHDHAIDGTRRERSPHLCVGKAFLSLRSRIAEAGRACRWEFCCDGDAPAPSERHAFAKRSDRPKENRELAAISRIDCGGRRRSARAAHTLELQLREKGDKRVRPHLHECRHVQSQQRFALVG